jgi:hypothetical protein
VIGRKGGGGGRKAPHADEKEWPVLCAEGRSAVVLWAGRIESSVQSVLSRVAAPELEVVD